MSSLFRRHSFGPLFELELVLKPFVHFLNVVLVLLLEHVGHLLVVKLLQEVLFSRHGFDFYSYFFLLAQMLGPQFVDAVVHEGGVSLWGFVDSTLVSLERVGRRLSPILILTHLVVQLPLLGSHVLWLS